MFDALYRYQYAVSPLGTGFGPGDGGGELSNQIRQQIEILKGKVTETGLELDRCRQEQEAFSMEYYTFKENNAKFESMQAQVCAFSLLLIKVPLTFCTI